MELQDEEDKKSVFLMGVGGEKTFEHKTTNAHPQASQTMTSATKIPHS